MGEPVSSKKALEIASSVTQKHHHAWLLIPLFLYILSFLFFHTSHIFILIILSLLYPFNVISNSQKYKIKFNFR